MGDAPNDMTQVAATTRWVGVTIMVEDETSVRPTAGTRRADRVDGSQSRLKTSNESFEFPS